MKLLITTQTVDKNDPILGFFHRWLTEFAKHFERIDVICLREGVHELPAHVHVHSLGKEYGESRVKYILRFYHFFSKIFFQIRVDYVFFHMGAINNVLATPFFLVRKFFKTRFYWWKTHGKAWALKERVASIVCDRVFTAGGKSFGTNAKKVTVVGHAIDTKMFIPSKNANHGGRVGIVVGRVVPIKKIEIAINAMSEVVRTHKDVTLHIIGNADNEVYKDSLKALAKKCSLDNISFSDGVPQPQIVSQYQRALFLLNPAYEAGFDKVVLEAMASGVIPLTSIPSFKPILDPYGLYIEPNDVSGYVKAILKIYEMNSPARDELTQKLRNIAVSNHSIDTLSKRIFGV